MARTSATHSSTSQFYINTVDNHFLNYNDENNGSRGYAVFGAVINGLDVVDQIEEVNTTTIGAFENTPETEVTIDSVTAMACPE
jgi:cyclophilin family peptidyl-prolyl cis-trans isomerase